MTIHRVKAPFNSRYGQFERGRQSLCVGLDLGAINHSETIRCYLGGNIDIGYEISTAKAVEVATRFHSFWTNKAGKTVAILPLIAFRKVYNTPASPKQMSLID